MFFSFMLDSTAGGRNNARPHSFLHTHDSSQIETSLSHDDTQSSHHSGMHIESLPPEVVH